MEVIIRESGGQQTRSPNNASSRLQRTALCRPNEEAEHSLFILSEMRNKFEDWLLFSTKRILPRFADVFFFLSPGF